MSLSQALVSRVKALFKRGGLTSDQKVGVELRDAVAGQGGADAAELARRFAAKEITATTFSEEMYLMTRRNIVSQYALARGGGIGALTDADRTAIEGMLGKQMGYLREFVREVATGTMSEEAIAQRAGLYPEAAIEAHSRGAAAAHGVMLDDHPPIHPRCACWLSYATNAAGETLVTWHLGDRPCSTCSALAARYQGVAVAA